MQRSNSKGPNYPAKEGPVTIEICNLWNKLHQIWLVDLVGIIASIEIIGFMDTVETRVIMQKMFKILKCEMWKPSPQVISEIYSQVKV